MVGRAYSSDRDFPLQAPSQSPGPDFRRMPSEFKTRPPDRGVVEEAGFEPATPWSQTRGA
jgi:hypothetical protein